jgi:hypothetical protein
VSLPPRMNDRLRALTDHDRPRSLGPFHRAVG